MRPRGEAIATSLSFPNVLTARLRLPGEDDDAFVYFDATKGFAMLKGERAFDDLFADSDLEAPAAGNAMPVDADDGGGLVRVIDDSTVSNASLFSTQFYPSLCALLQNTPRGEEAFRVALADALALLANPNG